MVYVNDKKFACESCIKGHRSSNCQHTDRPLFEIKRKGRPVSQCEKCRELRKTKRMHSKCTCAPAPTSEAGPSSQGLASTALIALDGSAPKPKTRRFKPIAPALPNGIKDLLPSTAGPSLPPTANLCRCGGKNASICTCGHDRAPSLSASGGLAALAQAAMFCCGGDLPNPPSAPAATMTVTAKIPLDHTEKPAAEEDQSRKHPRSCCSNQPSSRPPSPKPKRSKHSPNTATASSSTSWPKSHHDHPPLFSIPPLSQPSGSASMGPPPPFPPIPPVSTIMSYAPPECCCGTDCACPGCLKHRGESHASKDFEDCTEGTCGICVDHEGGIEMPEAAFAASHGGSGRLSTSAPTATSSSQTSSGHSASTSASTASKGPSFIDAFFARAATLPPPPPSRTRAGTLDPTNVVVYPRDLFSGDAERRKERGAAYGLVEVPKLECHCPGGCGCPEGRCGCGDSCTGCAPGPETEEGAREAVVDGPGSSAGVGASKGRTSASGCCV